MMETTKKAVTRTTLANTSKTSGQTFREWDVKTEMGKSVTEKTTLQKHF